MLSVKKSVKIIAGSWWLWVKVVFSLCVKILITGGLIALIISLLVGLHYWFIQRPGNLEDGWQYTGGYFEDSQYQYNYEYMEDTVALRRITRSNLISALDESQPASVTLTLNKGMWRFFVKWDYECIRGTSIETGRNYKGGEPIFIDCWSNDEHGLLLYTGSWTKDVPGTVNLDAHGFKANIAFKYWPYEILQRRDAIMNATK